jgi:uncharacterized membrane protein
VEETRRRERVAEWLGDRIGSWTCVVLIVVLLEAGMVAAVRQDEVDGAVAFLGVVVSGLVLLDLSILFMSVRRADRAAERLAMHHLEVTRQTTAELEELGDRLERLAVDVGRLDARIRAWNHQEPQEEGDR